MISLFKSYKTTEEKRQNKKELLLGLFSGIMLGISFPPVPFFGIVFLAFLPYLFVLVRRDSLASINRFTYFTAFWFNLIALYWVGSWTEEADPFLMISGVALIFFNPLLFLIPSTLYYITKKYLSGLAALLLLPVFFVFYEYIYTVSDFRFPWLTLGNSLAYYNSFIQIADIIGVYGLTLLLLYINILIFILLGRKLSNKWAKLICIFTLINLFAVPIIYGLYKTNNFKVSKEKVKIGLIQPNLNPWKKWEAGDLNEQLDLYLSLSKSAVDEGAEVIVWPESALPVYLMTGSYKKQVERIKRFIDSNRIYLVTGMPDATFFFDENTAPEDAKKTESGTLYTSYNSILYFQPDTEEVIKYAKIKLVPFGEKVPLVEHIPLLGDIIKWNVGISSWNTGREIVVFNSSNSNLKIGGVICIESIYPDFCAQFVQKGAEILVIVTNDSWYGNSSGPYQHKEFASLRAVENRRSLVRAANGGISCLIDPLGRTIEMTQMFERTYIVVEASLENPKTFYTKYPLLLPNTALSITIIIMLIGTAGKIYELTNKKKSKT